MRVHDETDWVLDLLREAGSEAVSLDELEVVGVRDPARALWELELAGHAVSRVIDTGLGGRRLTCVRLGAETLAPEAPAPATPATPGASAARDPRPLLAAVALLLLLVLLGRSRR